MPNKSDYIKKCIRDGENRIVQIQKEITLVHGIGEAIKAAESLEEKGEVVIRGNKVYFPTTAPKK